MVTGAIKNKVDKIWTDIWAGGITNPLTVIEQLTYLLISGPRVRVPGGAPEKPHSSVEKRAVWLLFLCQMASLTTF